MVVMVIVMMILMMMMRMTMRMTMMILNDDYDGDDDGNHDGDDNSNKMMMGCWRNNLMNTFSRRLADFVFINIVIKNVHIYTMSHFSYMVFFISQNSSTT